MNRITSFIIFISIASLIYLGLHVFVYKVITGNLDIQVNTKSAIKIFFWFSGLSFLIGTFLSRAFKIHYLNYYAYVWLGIIAVSFFVLLAAYTAGKFAPSRVRLFTIVGLCITGIIVLVSLLNGLRKPIVREITVPIKTLPASLAGFSIVHLSDIHLESYKSKKTIGYIVDKVNGLKPDLVVITGDLIDSNICEDAAFCEHLERLNATNGVLAVTGNHEFYAGLDIFNELASRSNIKILRNENVTVAGLLQVAGVDDDEARRFGGKGPDLETALKGCDLTKPVILLYHRPDNFAAAAAKGVDLQLSGHTHGGQIPPMDLLVWLYYKYPAGLFKKGDSFIYTSYGTGYWGPPMRFLSRNEIVKITLSP
ncbi:MAG: metallophosphoesterase [Candidatus Aminicenantes bacterium]|nr:metallophosphoesterase [Candidatus Aminicenantes bacterium]